jgi:hypothetical protein
MNSSTGITIDDTAHRIVGQFECEQLHLFELIDELRPGAEEQPRRNPHNRAQLLREGRRSMERLNQLVVRLRSLQQEAEPELQYRLGAALFAAEISVDTAGVAVDQLCQAPINWRPELPPVPWTH